jgi:hypothetical protein
VAIEHRVRFAKLGNSLSALLSLSGLFGNVQCVVSLSAHWRSCAHCEWITKEAGGKLPVMMRLVAFPQIRRNTLALGLCLLAVLFALEAKTAWYGPAKGPGTDIQSQKALPADLPALVTHGASVLPQITFPLSSIFLRSIAAIGWVVAGSFPGINFDSDLVPYSAAPYFSPALFFRPPPLL